MVMEMHKGILRHILRQNAMLQQCTKANDKGQCDSMERSAITLIEAALRPTGYSICTTLTVPLTIDYLIIRLIRLYCAPL